MKFLLALPVLLFGFFAHAEAINWSDLEVDHKYVLNTEIVMTPEIKLSKGIVLTYREFQDSDVPVFYLTFKNEMCNDPSLQNSDIILVNPSPDDHSSDRSVGVVLETDCNVGIYLEPKDYYYPSLFEEVK